LGWKDIVTSVYSSLEGTESQSSGQIAWVVCPGYGYVASVALVSFG